MEVINHSENKKSHIKYSSKDIEKWLKEEGYLDKPEIDKSTYKLAEEYIKKRGIDLDKSKEEYEKCRNVIGTIISRILKKYSFEYGKGKWINIRKLLEQIYELDKFTPKIIIKKPPLLDFIIRESNGARLQFIKDLVEGYFSNRMEITDEEIIEKLRKDPKRDPDKNRIEIMIEVLKDKYWRLKTIYTYIDFGSLKEQEVYILPSLIKETILFLRYILSETLFNQIIRYTVDLIERQTLIENTRLERLQRLYLALILLSKLQEVYNHELFVYSLKNITIIALKKIEEGLLKIEEIEKDYYILIIFFIVSSEILSFIADELYSDNPNKNWIKDAVYKKHIYEIVKNIWKNSKDHFIQFEGNPAFNMFIRELVRCRNILERELAEELKTSPEGSQEVKNDEKQH